MSEYLIFDGVTLDGPIECEDLKILRNYVTRGSNLELPGAAGTRAYKPVRDQLSETLTWFVRGHISAANDQPQDPEEGIVANLEFYRNLFTSPGDPDTGEHTITLHLSDFIFTGTMQIREYADPTTGPMTATILTRFTIPSGQLEATGS